MGWAYWLNLFGSILLTVLAGLFTRFLLLKQKHGLAATVCVGNKARAGEYAYLCGKKVSIHDAKLIALMRIPAISLNKARIIRSHFREDPQATIDDLLRQKGIGPKTITLLREQFY